jgi:hypothetical protein
MGFIPQISTKTLYAYLTPKGREYILEGDKQDFQVAYFTLHDDDVNYFVSSNISAGTTSTYLTLPSGFVPDITGDADTCIKSIAEGTNVNLMSSLSGSSITDSITNRLTVGRIGTDGNINTRVCSIGVPPSSIIINGGSLNPNLTTYTVQTFNVVISPPSGDGGGITSAEITNTQFYVEIKDSNNGAKDFIINGVSSSKVLIKPSLAITPINITFKKGNITSLSGSISVNFLIVITPFRSFVDLGTNSSVTYTATIATGSGGVNQPPQ